MEQNGTEKKDVLLSIALATGQNITQAGQESGLGRTTVYRKLANPKFRRRVARLRQQFISEALGRLTDQMCSAADRLVETMSDDDPRLRLRAARTLIMMAVKLRDSVDLSDRMHDLEIQLARKRAEP